MENQPSASDRDPRAFDDRGEETLRIDDDDRYARLRLIAWWRQDRLKRSRVLVVGAGALGNEAIKNFALLGAGTIVVIDKDEVEASNLSRSVLFRQEDGGKPKAEVAARRASELNPDSRLIPIQGDVLDDLGLGVFREIDVVVGCLDNREARLWVNRQCWKTSTPWVDAGIQEIQGVVKIFTPPDSACYECAMTARDYQLLNLRYSCPLLRRDQILEGKVPTSPTIASLMGAIEVQEALKILHGLPVQGGSALVFNGVGNLFYSTRLPFRDDCLSHETYPEPIALPIGRDSLAAELFEAARSSLEGPLTLWLDRDLVVAVDCPRCGGRTEMLQTRTSVRQERSICPVCREPGRPEIVSRIVEKSPLARRSLRELGVPAFDILRVVGATDSDFFLLDADRPDWLGIRPPL